MSDPRTWRVQLISDIADFAALRATWNAVPASGPVGRIFSSHEWFEAAWQWREQSARLYVLCLVENQKLVAALPLVWQEASTCGINYRQLSFLTVPDTQSCDVIVAERDRSAACVAFADELARRQREWDVIRLGYLPPGSIAALALRNALAAKRFASQSGPSGGNPFIRLESTWESYYASRGRRLKKANNLAASRVSKAGAARIDWLAPGTGDPANLERFLDCAIDISGKSWKTRTGNSLDNPGPQAFIRRLSHAAYERGWLSIWMLSVDDRPLAMEYQLVADGRVHALRSDFDAQFEQISPGAHLNRCLLEHLFRAGLKRYYMGPGDNAYKHRWTEEVETIEDLSVYGRSMTGRCLAAWETTLKPLARRLRDRLRPSASSEVANEAAKESRDV